MSHDVGFGVLAVGVLLVLVALLGGRVFTGVAPRTAAALRAVLGIAGAGLVAWILIPELGLRPHPAAPAVIAAVPQPETTPVDLVGLASQAMAGCPTATTPVIPDGASAKKAVMIAASNAFQAYDAATIAYTQCVDAAVAAARKQAGAASAADLQSLTAFGDSAHNTAIDQEQAAADQMNLQVRAFKAKHPRD